MIISREFKQVSTAMYDERVIIHAVATDGTLWVKNCNISSGHETKWEQCENLPKKES